MAEYPLGIKNYTHVRLLANKYHLPSIDNKRNVGEKGDFVWEHFLYIPNELSDGVSSGWSQESVSSTGQAIADITSGGNQSGFWDKAKTVGMGGMRDAIAGFDKLAPGTVASANNNSGAFAGQILRPNDVLVLSSVNNNTISFAWTCNPKSQAEAEQIKTIITNLKNAARPSLPDKDSITLEYPPLIDVFINTSVTTGQAQSRKGTRKSLFNYNNMVIESFSVTYGGGANEALFYHDGNPVTVNISISLKSIRPGYYTGNEVTA